MKEQIEQLQTVDQCNKFEKNNEGKMSGTDIKHLSRRKKLLFKTRTRTVNR